MPDIEIDDKTRELWAQLTKLHCALREHTKNTYQRINPFFEDLFNWQERGNYWSQQENDITLYNSATVIGDVKIGNKTWVGPFCLLDGSGGLTIGDYCSIAAGCQIYTHDTVKWALSGGKEQYEYANTHIGNCCFVGAHSVILKGVVIGNHCVVAAGSVVNKNIPDLTIVGGVPAKKIGKVVMDQDGVRLEYIE